VLELRSCALQPELIEPESVEQLYAFFYTLPRSPVASTSKALPDTSVQNPLTLGEDDKPVGGAVTQAAPTSGWIAFNPRAEFARQGVGSRTKAWRFTDINRDYTFCPTYPSKMVVPSRISDTLLTYAAKYRSKARIPALSYLHWANHVS
jgi:myotubularin-related protein 6/7/8